MQTLRPDSPVRFHPGTFTATWCACVLLLLPGLLTVRAAVKTWTGAGANANWSTAANWTPSVPPVDGDDLVFSSGAAQLLNTNNISGRRLSSITFTGSGGNYVLRGYQIVLSNGVVAAHTTGINSIQFAITNGASQTITANSGGRLFMDGDIVLNNFNLIVDNTTNVNLGGVISGNGSLVKNGSGTLLLDGTYNNTYTGSTVVNAGTLELNDVASATEMVPNDIFIEPSGTLLLSEGNQIADTANVTVYGLFDLHGWNEKIATLTMIGGAVSTSWGILTNGNITTLASSSASTISGNLDLGTGTRTFTVADGTASVDLEITAVISGGTSGSPFFFPAGFVKAGPGILRLSGANTYSGPTTINEGQLTANNNLALGGTNAPLFGTAATTVNSNAVLLLNNAHVTNEILVLNSTNPGGALQDNATGDWIGPITLDTNVVIEASSLLQLGGPIDGPGGFTKISANVLRMIGTDANTYGGTTIVNAGTLELGRDVFDGSVPGDLVIGDGLGSDVVRNLFMNQIANTAHVFVNSNALYELNDQLDGIGSLEMSGGAVDSGTSSLVLFGDITVNPISASDPAEIYGILNLGGASRVFDVASGATALELRVNAVISNGGIVKTGTGTLQLLGANTYAGLTTINGGGLRIETDTGLGAATAGTVLAGESRLVLDGVDVLGEALTNNSSIASLDYYKTNTWSGSVVLNAQLDIRAISYDARLAIPSVISGSGGVAKDYDGVLTYSGASANTYSGLTIINGGTLELMKTAGVTAIPGDLTIGDNSGPIGDDRVVWMRDHQVNDSSTITLGNGLLSMPSNVETIGTLSGSGDIDLGLAGALTFGTAADSIFYGSISGSQGRIVKQGSGTVTFAGTSTFGSSAAFYSTILEGTLLVNGAIPNEELVVAGPGTLGGTGTVANVGLNGALRPGTSPGILTSSNLSLFASGHFYVELNGPFPGIGYDQVNVRGTVSLGNCTLHVVPNFTSPVAVGDEFVIIRNDGADAVIGAFTGLPGGSTIAIGDYTFVIHYDYGTGNDVVLVATSVPGAAGAATVTLGNGDHVVDPNECNFLDLVISNKTGGTMSGVTATLSTVTPRIVINQPYSDYPDVPVGGRATNATPFQISTLPGYPCAMAVQLQLAVKTATHGNFVVPFVLPTGAPSTTALRYDNALVTNVPDVGSIESAISIGSWAGGPITKVVVSLWLGAPIDSDMDLTLVAPNGTPVVLSSGNGAGANFGTGGADANRTTFDDAAATSIVAGTPPFVGAFQPEGSLATLNNTLMPGDWRLRITDNGFFGTPDTLRSWSLFLYGTTCADGGGACDTCLESIAGVVSGSDPTQVNRWFRDYVPASCASPKQWSGYGDVGTNYHYDAYNFTNTSATDACVTVQLQSETAVMASAYLGSYEYWDISRNYLADGGESTADAAGFVTTFSCTVPAGSTLVVVVNEQEQDSGDHPYTLSLAGLPCPPPELAINSLSGTNAVRVHWPTWAGGFKLEGNTDLTKTNWAGVTNEPTVFDNRYNVTNTSLLPTNRFYRLHRP